MSKSLFLKVDSPFVIKILFSLFTLSMSLVLAFNANSTVVEFKTNLGDIRVNLYDETTPITVNNFLDNVVAGKYNGSFIHRSVSSFVVQGGGFTIDPEDFVFGEIESGEDIENEPLWSNVRGTIAMAKSGGSNNSANLQWYFNLADNHEALDAQAGGFTVFGQVDEAGLEILDQINALPTFTFNLTLSEVPLVDYSIEDASNQKQLEYDNFLIIEDMIIIEDSKDSARDLDISANTLIGAVSLESEESPKEGGTFLLMLLLMLPIYGFRKLNKR